MSSSEEAQKKALAAQVYEAYLKPPPVLANVLLKIKPIMTPVIKGASMGINLIGPLYVRLFNVGYYAYEKLPVDLFNSVLGLGLAFCGGAYCSSIAAIEAFRMSGWEQTRCYLLDIQEDVKAVWAAQQADNEKDADGNTKTDVDELLDKGEYAELLKRKLAVTAMAIKDPSKLAFALGSVYTAWLAIQATLRLEFAKTITLGLSIAELAQPAANKLALPLLTHVLPREYHHWLPMLIKSATKALGVAIAWRMQVIVSSYHLALRGGLLFARSLLRWSQTTGKLPSYSEEGYFDEALGYAVAASGLAFQWKCGFTLPFPLNIIFFPLDVVEWYIRWTITSDAPIA